jgi:hypothetical protein
VQEKGFSPVQDDGHLGGTRCQSDQIFNGPEEDQEWKVEDQEKGGINCLNTLDKNTAQAVNISYLKWTGVSGSFRLKVDVRCDLPLPPPQQPKPKA